MKVEDQIIEDINSNDVLLYMKGLPGKTPCGFSERIVMILDHIGITFETRDVLESDELRRTIKEHANVRTLPLLFVQGHYIGGSDDIKQMHEANTLKAFFEARGIPTTADASAEPLLVGDIKREQIISCSKAS